MSSTAAEHRPRHDGSAERCPRGCAGHNRETLLTLATALTVVRTLATVALGLVAIDQGSDVLLGVALLVHWVGDIGDGLLARWRDEETVVGAVLDICADRLCVAMIYVGFVTTHPEFGLALAVYLVEFMLVDAVLSLWFLRWPISGPNYFARVDPLVWRWNWWPPAKAVNSAVPALLCVWLDLPWVALAAAAALLVVKCVCLVRVVPLPVPAGVGCAGLHG
ncbi:hypothetical protein BH18ACT7_BH18ACT7_04710 [soil metagenome]